MKILHVDDEPDQLRFLKQFVELNDPSIDVESVASPSAAIKLLEEGSFDCIVSDYDMPQLDGIELARRVRETSDIPFIIYTGKGSEEVAETAFEAGVNDYLRKETSPSHYQVLARRIRNAVDQKRAQERVRTDAMVLEGINRIFQGALTCETEEELARTCLDVVEEVSGSAFGYLGEINEDGRFDTISLSNPGYEACIAPESDVLLMLKNMEIRGFHFIPLRSGESLKVNNPSSHPESVGTPQGHPEITSFVGVPLKQSGETFGMFGLANKQGGYTQADLSILEPLAVAITEALMRKRAELQSLQSEARFRGIAERSFDVIFTSDLDGCLTYVSPSVERVLGYVPEEINGKPFSTFVSESERPRAVQGFAERLRGEHGIGLEFELVRKDGASVFVQANTSPIFRDGEVVGTQGVFRDITVRRRAEEQIRKLTYRLNGLKPVGCFISESHERCLKAYADLSMHGVNGLCIIRENPEKLLDDYGLKREEVVLLSSSPIMGFPALSDLQSISRSISESLSNGVGVVLLDGLEYLINRFEFDHVLTLLQEMRFEFLEAGALLLLPASFEAIGSRERSLLLSELKVLQ